MPRDNDPLTPLAQAILGEIAANGPMDTDQLVERLEGELETLHVGAYVELIEAEMDWALTDKGRQEERERFDAEREIERTVERRRERE